MVLEYIQLDLEDLDITERLRIRKMATYVKNNYDEQKMIVGGLYYYVFKLNDEKFFMQTDLRFRVVGKVTPVMMPDGSIGHRQRIVDSRHPDDRGANLC